VLATKHRCATLCGVERWDGEEIRRRREAKGFTIPEFADAVGVSERAVSKWERGESEPYGRNYAAIVRVLSDVSTGDTRADLSQVPATELLLELSRRLGHTPLRPIETDEPAPRPQQGDPRFGGSRPYRTNDNKSRGE
jgi:transcriptional regulator with XRE-family HTH domain